MLPQSKKLKPFFDNAGFDIEDFVVLVETSAHRLKSGKGLHTKLGGNWNKQWKEFFKKFPTAEADDILYQLAKMLMAKAKGGAI